MRIIADILSIADAGAKKTRIMYQANLSYRLVEKYLTNLLDSGLVERDGDSFYQVTCKGKEFLQMYTSYIERCRRIGEEIDGAQKDVLLLENMCFNNEYNFKRMPGRREISV